MPLFYVHLRSPTRYERDEIGLERPDLEAAYLDVCGAVPEIAADLMREGLNPLDFTYDVTDGDGALLLEVPFTERLEGDKARRPPSQAQVPLSEAERAEDLVASVQQQVETLHANMRNSRLWLERLRREREG